MSSKPILYSYFRSSCSWRVRIALAIKGIEYEYHAVNLMKDGGENLKPEYIKLNPLGQVPALVMDGHTLLQSVAMIEYLDETRPEPPLLPKDPFTRSRVRAVADTITAGIQPIQNVAILRYVGSDQSQTWGKHWITQGFASLERLLKETSGQYCVGDELTLADLCLAPQVYNASRFQVDMTQFPIVSAINERLLAIDAFRISHPGCQPDTPDDLKTT